MAMEARWNGEVIARSEATVVVEGNHYFPAEDVSADMLEASSTSTHCPWKGDASYYSITAGGKVNKDAAWYYPAPKSAAAQIAGHIAFWKGVEVVKA